MRSQLRPETRDAPLWQQVARNGTAYLMILNAIEQQDGLIAGRLHRGSAHCAVGSFFDVNPKLALETTLLDEVAMVNDSIPHVTPRQRKIRVARWLRWKLKQLGMPGFARAKKP